MENDSQITACDAEVLKYFRKHGPASTADAKKALPKIGAVDARIKMMSTPELELLQEDVDTLIAPNRPLHQSLGTYHITPKGEIALEDHLAETQRKARHDRLSTLWAPIAVGLLAYLFAYALDHIFG